MGSLLLALIYVCFISLGLPDSLLGSSWPVVHAEMVVPVSYAGIVTMVIFLGTILASLFSDKLLRRYGAGKVTAVSVALTAVGLLGYAFSHRFWLLLVWSVPYGLGAGGVDAILNNYVALHFKAQHMSWLHCMWGVGASVSPYIMRFSLMRLESWNYGYLIVAVVQIILSVIVFASVPIWKTAQADGGKVAPEPPAVALTFREIFRIKGAIACFFSFFGYCAMEQIASLWASSYMVERWSLAPEAAAGFAGMFYIGITLGRFANGFFAMRRSDHFLIRAGIGVIAGGIALLMVPLHPVFALAGFAVIGLGCAPIYPCIIHMTPDVFGADKSQAMIGVQMAFAYTGFLIMPPLFGVIAEHISISLLPVFLLLHLGLIFVTHEIVMKNSQQNAKSP